MFIEKLKEKFGADTPIFTKEIIESFPDYTRAYVFRLIKNAINNNLLCYDSYGVYYIPTNSIFGLSSISVEDIIIKRYVQKDNDVYGIISGLQLLNGFGVTTQVAAVIEVVSNNESSKYREIMINNRRFIIRRSRFKITNDNRDAYLILQLFNDLLKGEELNWLAKNNLKNYIKEKNVSKAQILELSLQFPGKVLKRIVESGVLNDVA